MNSVRQHNRPTLLWPAGCLIAFAGLLGCQESMRDAVTAEQQAEAAELATALVSNKPPSEATDPAGATGVPKAIAEFCSDCHKLPQPSSFPRDVWYEEIRKGYEFYARSGRTDLNPPPPADVVSFYREQAPEAVVFPQTAGLSKEWAAKFTTTQMDWKDGAYLPPAISSIQWLEIQTPDPTASSSAVEDGSDERSSSDPESGAGQGASEDQSGADAADNPDKPKEDIKAKTSRQSFLFATDMRDGSISLIRPERQSSARSLVGRLSNPARVNVCDFDDDGLSDLIASDLGSFNPYDHPYGGVALFKQVQGMQFQPQLVKNRIGRVADAIVGDFREDQRQEVVYAEFGHRERGGLHLLTAAEDEAGQLAMQDKVLNNRPGVVRVIQDDVNGDGRLDLVTLTTQEYEQVDVWINAGRVFNRHPVWSAPDLACGSVSLVLCDIDADGDNDMVVTCGDSFDNNYASLNHGVYLIENQGELHYASRRLLMLPGAYQAVPCDIDGDGDLDIAAVANLPTTIKPLQLREREADSIVVLEQLEGGKFDSHVLRKGPARFSSITAGDFDQNGKVDLAVGVQLFGTDPAGSPASQLPRILVLWQD